MRRARLTWPGAYHHVMARGINGIDIFAENLFKHRFIDLVQRQKRILDIPVYAWCVMDNHYHMVLQNRHGRMSEFMKRVNGPFGQYYRFKTESRGVVFQGRFRSLLIQDDQYLSQVIRYVLHNPVKAGLAHSISTYQWSSAKLYFSKSKEKSSDIEFVEQLFGCSGQLFGKVVAGNAELPIVQTKMGNYVGDDSYAGEALRMADKRYDSWSKEHRRGNEKYIQPLDVSMHEFKNKFGIWPDDIDLDGVKGKRLRGEWLVWLRDRCGLTYREVSKMEIFADLQFSSLGAIYRNALKRSGNF